MTIGINRRGLLCSVGLMGMACAISGCNREEIHSYRVPKSRDSMAGSGNVSMPGASAPNSSPMASSGGTVIWTVPSGWNEVKSEQAMRVATFQAPGSEITVAAFPGLVGGNLANVNRWRGQIGLDPIGEAELAKLLVSSHEGQTQIFLLSLTGSAGQVMLAAIILPGDDKTWFVKSVSDASNAAAIKADFEKFSKSFRLENAPAAHPSPPPSASVDAAPSDPSIPNGVLPNSAPASEIDARLAKWSPPSHWKLETQSGGILAAAYAATNSEGGARVTVTSLLGDGGGQLANINRWREQLGLTAFTDLAQQTMTSIGGGTTQVDLTNTEGTDRMISIIVPAGESTWFFKLRGNVKGVEAEKDAFVKFAKAMGLGT